MIPSGNPSGYRPQDQQSRQSNPLLAYVFRVRSELPTGVAGVIFLPLFSGERASRVRTLSVATDSTLPALLVFLAVMDSERCSSRKHHTTITATTPPSEIASSPAVCAAYRLHLR